MVTSASSLSIFIYVNRCNQLTPGLNHLGIIWEHSHTEMSVSPTLTSWPTLHEVGPFAVETKTALHKQISYKMPLISQGRPASLSVCTQKKKCPSLSFKFFFCFPKSRLLMQVANCWFCTLLLWMHRVSKNNELKLGPVLSAITESLNWPLILLFNMGCLGMDHYYRLKFWKEHS